MKLEILFQNSNFVIVNKALAVLTVPSRMGEQDSRPVLGLILQKEIGRQVFPVHRLDFEVSGLVMFALNADAHQWGNEIFEQKKVSKSYSALTLETQDFSHFPEKVQVNKEGFDPFSQKQFEWNCRILKGKRRSYEAEHGQLAKTMASALKKESGRILWHLNPITGRSHQLRYELSRHGFPILGDELYGSKIPWGESSIALRSHELNFEKCKEAERYGLPTKFSIDSLTIR